MEGYTVVETRDAGGTKISYGYSTIRAGVWRCWQWIDGPRCVQVGVQEFDNELSCYFAFIDTYYFLRDLERSAS